MGTRNNTHNTIQQHTLLMLLLCVTYEPSYKGNRQQRTRPPPPRTLYTMNTTINAEPNFYDFHCQVLFTQTIYKLDEGLFMHNCICVFTMMVLCRQKSRFLNMGGVRSRKYCASISDMTTTWDLRRDVVLRINVFIKSIKIEARRML